MLTNAQKNELLAMLRGMSAAELDEFRAAIAPLIVQVAQEKAEAASANRRAPVIGDWAKRKIIASHDSVFDAK
jgi:hypothetical protein